MSRQVLITSGDRQIGGGVFPEYNSANEKALGSDIQIYVDGHMVSRFPVPSKLIDTEPDDIGSQVEGVTRSISRQSVFTKIGPSRWAVEYVDYRGRQCNDVVRWNDIVCYRVIRPQPKEPDLPEPQGWCAVIKTDCHEGCLSTQLFARLQFNESDVEWVCKGCGHEYSWSYLTGDAPAVEIISEGF